MAKKKTTEAAKVVSAPDVTAISQERDQAVMIANYTAGLMLNIEDQIQSKVLTLAKVDTPSKINFWWVLRNWRIIADLLEAIWKLIKEFRDNIKFNEPNSKA